MKHMIETTNLSKRYDSVLRVNDLNITVPEQSIYGFLGPNGAGKTTTLKMLLGLVKPSNGTIHMLNTELTKQTRISLLRNIGSLIESPSFYGHLTGEENLRIIQTLKSAPEKEIARVLQIVRLDQQRKKKVSQYSLGMKQRLGIACALLNSPKLLLLDEPTNGLDPAGIQEMRELILTLPKEFGMTVLVSSHLLSEIDQIADYVGIIEKGELVFEDSLSELHAHSKQSIALRLSNTALGISVLNSLNLSFEQEGEYLLIPNLPDQHVSDLCRICVEKQIGIIRVEKREKSLEDIFLEFTGKVTSL